MKKRLCFALLCLLSFGCSQKEEPMVDIDGEVALGSLKIDISAEGAMPGGADSGVWNQGDRINIWFDDHYGESSPDLIIQYDGSKWNKWSERGDCMLTASGTLAALFEGGSNLDAFVQNDSPATYGIPPADIDGFSFVCTPMVTRTTELSYSVKSSKSSGCVLKASIRGWKYATRFKVLIPTDPSMSMAADKYALSVSKVCHPLKSFSIRKNPGSGHVDFGISSSIMDRYSGGVQEKDGIAFYFDNMSCSDEKLTFALLESGAAISKTYTTPGNVSIKATSDSKCVCEQIPYNSFSGASFSSGDGETPKDENVADLQIIYQLTDLEDSVTLSLAKKLAARIGAVQGEEPSVMESDHSSVHEREIIIGRTSRPQSKEYYSQKRDDFVWRINYSGGSVIITAGGSWALEYAVDKFTEDYLAPGFVYQEGKVVEGTVRGKQLFPLTEGCNLRILDQNVWVREENTNTDFWKKNGESCAISVRSRRLAQVVRSCMPDIITFQEFGDGLNKALKDTLVKYNYATALRTSGDYTAIFYNSKTIEYAGRKWHAKFPKFIASNGITKAPDDMKSYTAALFRHKATNKEFLVVSTHIFTALADDYDYECKTSEVATIIDLVGNILKTYNVPVFLAGDMNCQRAFGPMQLLETSGYRHIVDLATVSADGSNGWHVCSDKEYKREYDPSMVGHYMGWKHDRNEGAVKCVDHIYLYNSAGVEVKVFERMHAWFTVLLSDHYPNYADIAL